MAFDRCLIEDYLLTYLRLTYAILHNFLKKIARVRPTFCEWRNSTARATLRANISMSSSTSTRLIVELLVNQSLRVTSHNSNTITGPTRMSGSFIKRHVAVDENKLE